MHDMNYYNSLVSIKYDWYHQHLCPLGGAPAGPPVGLLDVVRRGVLVNPQHVVEGLP